MEKIKLKGPNIIISIFIIAIIGYIFSMTYMYLNQKNLVFFPDKTVDKTPQHINIEFEDIAFTATDNIKRHAWLVSTKNANLTVLYCHGNTGNISNTLDRIQFFQNQKLNIFVFDYQGYGKSNGSPSEKNTYDDALAAWNYLTTSQNIKPKNIIIYGHSLGASIAANLASKTTPKATILESGFLSIPKLGKEQYPWLPVKWLCRIKYPTINWIQKITHPLLIIHSTDDELIPYMHGKLLFYNANQPKQFLKLTNATHDEGVLSNPTEFQTTLISLLNM